MGVKIRQMLLYHSVATQRHPLFECAVSEGNIIFIFVSRRRCNINFSCVGINTKHVATCTKISAPTCKLLKYYGIVSRPTPTQANTQYQKITL